MTTAPPAASRRVSVPMRRPRNCFRDVLCGGRVSSAQAPKASTTAAVRSDRSLCRTLETAV